MKGKFAINGLRVCMLGVTLCAVASFGLWHFGPQWVDRFDHWARAKYLSHNLEAVEQAEAILKEDPERGIAAMRLALEQFPDVHKGEWLFDPKQSAVLKLAQAYKKTGQVESAIASAAQVYETDVKNIRARRLWVQYLLSNEATSSEGFQELGRLLQEFPEHSANAKQFVRSAFRRGEPEAAGRAGVRHFLSAGGCAEAWLPKGIWYGWWTAKKKAKGFGADRRVKAAVQADGSLVSIRFDVPSGQSGIRVDLPPRCELGATIEIMECRPSGDGPAMSLMGLATASHHMTLSDTGLQVHGESDPWFSIELPEALARTGFEFQMVIRMDGAPEWMRQALSQSSAVEETYLLGERGRTRSTQVLRAIQLQGWIDEGLSYSWENAPGQVEFRPDPGGAGRYHFQIDLDVPAGGGEWKLLPGACYAWQLGGLSARWSGDMGTLIPRPESMWQESPRVWTSLWFESGFSLALEPPAGTVGKTRVSLSGWIQ